MKSGQILQSIKYALKRGKSTATPLIANISLTDGTTVAAVIFENFTWEKDELVPVKRNFESLYSHVEVVQTTKHDLAEREGKD